MKKYGKIIVIFLVMVAFILATVIQVSAEASEKTRVWVEYAPGKAAAVSGSLRQAGAQFHYHIAELDSFVVTVSTAAMQSLVNNPNITLIEEDAPRFLVQNIKSEVQQEFIPQADPTQEQVVPYGIDMVQARDIWDADRDGVVDEGTPTGAERTVCIIDTGYYRDHEDLVNLPDNAGIVQTESEWWDDMDGHGTHVAGTVSAMNNDVGVVGVSPGTVGLYIVKIFGNDGLWVSKAHASDLVEAAFYCRDNGEANVISMSLSGTQYNGKEKNAFDLLYSQGILSIAAASNEGIDEYHYPASYDSVVSVAALDSDKNIASFSQFNDQVELAAPGVHVLSSVPYLATAEITTDGITYDGNPIEFAGYGIVSGDLVYGGLCGVDEIEDWTNQVVLCQRGVYSFYDKVMNVQSGGGIAAVIFNDDRDPPDVNFNGTLGEEVDDAILAISLCKNDGEALLEQSIGSIATVENTYVWGTDDTYEYYDGTSMATPHVSGVAALVWSAYPGLSNVDIREALDATAFDLGDPGRDVYYGYGLVQAYDALEYLSEPGYEGMLDVSLTLGKKMFSPGELVSIEVTVESQGVAIEGAMVESTITTANGPQITSTLTTDQDGKATINYRVNLGRDGEGKYTVEVTAVMEGYEDGSDSTFFQVKR